MKIGLIDVDGHHFPNLALMRISARGATFDHTDDNEPIEADEEGSEQEHDKAF